MGSVLVLVASSLMAVSPHTVRGGLHTSSCDTSGTTSTVLSKASSRRSDSAYPRSCSRLPVPCARLVIPLPHPWALLVVRQPPWSTICSSVDHDTSLNVRARITGPHQKPPLRPRRSPASWILVRDLGSFQCALEDGEPGRLVTYFNLFACLVSVLSSLIWWTFRGLDIASR